MGAIDEKKMRLLKEVSSMKKYWINKVKQIEDTMLETYQIEDENDKSVINIELSNELSDRIKTVTKNNPFAEFVLFFSVYQILLQRYNNSRYQVVLTPAFELKQKKLENWVFCEIEDSQEKTFKELLNDNIKKFKDIFANQFYSIEELMAEKSEILNFLCKNIFVLETCQNINAIEKYLNSKKNQVAFVINKKENSFEVKCYHFKNENKEDAISVLRKYVEFLNIVTEKLDINIKEFFLSEETYAMDKNEVKSYNLDVALAITDENAKNGNKFFRYLYNNNIELFKCTSPQLNMLLNTSSYKKTGFNNCLKKIIVEDNTFVVKDLKKCISENNVELICVTDLGNNYKLATKYVNQERVIGVGFPCEEWFYDIKNIYGASQYNLADGNVFVQGQKSSYLTGYKKQNGEIVISKEHLPYFIFSGMKFSNDTIINKIVDDDILYATFVSDSTKKLECIYIVTNDKEKDQLELQNRIRRIIDISEDIKIIFGTKLPIDSNGKADAEAIRKLVKEKINIESRIEPRNIKEKAVLNVFKRILLDDSINMNSNFFDFGGDSIKAIQISAHLKEEGYGLEISDILSLQIISKIADTVVETQNTYYQGIYEGEAGLVPVQERFLRNKEEAYNVFNHSITFINKKGIDIEAAKAAYYDIIEHHDTLRTIFVRDNKKIRQIVKNNVDDCVFFESEDLTNDADYKNIIWNDINSIQKKINIFNGKNSYVKLYKTLNGDYLSITIHHMVVDGVSWRIILEDFMTAYNMHKEGKCAILPMKTAPFLEWVKDYARYSSNLPEWEKDYWSRIINEEEKIAICNIENAWKKHKVKIFSLDEEKTNIMIKKMNRAFHAEINEILLAGLGMAELKCNNRKNTFIAIEGHGREKVISNKDISRTVGWFTSYYDVVFENDNSVIKQIAKVKKVFNEIPYKGVNYGTLKFHNQNNKGFSYVKSQILFNYLGDVDSFISDDFHLATELNPIQNIHEEYDTGYLLSINSIILNNKLQFTVDYNEDIYSHDEIDKFFEYYLNSLAEIIDVGCNRIEKNLCKFDLVNLSEEETNQLNIMFDINKIENIMPLSLMQQGMYYHWKVSKEKDLYSEQYLYELHGKIDYELFVKSVNEIVRNNQVLRTVFVEDNMADIYQVILSKMEINCSYYDLNNFDNPEKELEKIRYIDCQKGFDLHNGPMIRISIIDFGFSKFYILLCFHHIIMDGWSVPLILKQLIDVYTSLKNKETLTEKKYMIQFEDYIKWLNNYNKQESIYFWKNILKDVDTITKLPYQKKINAVEYSVKQYFRILSKEKEEALVSLARKEGVTLFQIIQSAWAVLLSKYNKDETVVFGTVVSGRPIELMGADEMPGLCINTIPIVRKVTADKSFDELVKDRISNEMSKHSFLPLVEIQNLSQLKNELVSHILIFENYPLDNELKNGDYVEKMGFSFVRVDEFWKTNYNFNLMIVPNNGIEFCVVYNEKIFDESAIEKILDQFFVVLDKVLEKNDIKLKNLSIVSDEEKKNILDQSYNDRFDLKDAQPVYKIIEKTATRYSNNIAIVFKDQEITYSELIEQIDNYFHFLMKSGVKRNEVVGVLMDRSPKMIAVVLGILKCGCAYLPLDKSNPAERLNYMINDSQIRFMIVNGEISEKIEFDGFLLDADEVWNKKELINDDEIVDYDIHDLMYMIYTSGSTGKPKAVCIEHRSVYNFMISIKKELPYNDVNMLCITSISFDIFGLEVYLPLMYGHKVVIGDEVAQINPDMLAEIIEEKSINMIQMTPSRMKMLLSSAKAKMVLSKVKTIILGGEALSQDIVTEIQQVTNARIFNVYGPTETTIWSSIYEVKSADRICIGKPIGNNSFYILDDNNNLVPNGIPGELAIGGDGLARGYYNCEDITNEKFIDNVFEHTGKIYKTGDIVVRDNDGNFSYIERKDFQLKMHGFRIELGEIEICFKKEMYCQDVVVIPIEKDNEKVLVAYYVNNKTLDYDEVINKISQKLPYYMLPSYIVKIDKIPVNVNGKVDRSALKSISINTHEKKADILPSTNTEKTVYDIWKEYLKISEFDINDNFFHIGGHSLKAIKICTALRDRGYDVGIYDLYKMPTVKLLSEFIDQSMQNSVGDLEKQKEEMLQYIANKYGEFSLESYEFNNNTYTVLVLDVSKKALDDLKSNLKLKYNSAIIPDYIIDKSKSFYDNLTDDDINAILDDIEKKYKINNRIIVESSVEKVYNISGTQIIRMSDPQNIIAYFEVDASFDEIKKIMCEVINEQSLMRCVMVMKNDDYAWEQHTQIDQVDIAYLDFSGKSTQIYDFAIKKIVEEMFKSKLDEQSHILYKMVYIKVNEKRAKLLLVSNHIIFDGFSAQILSNSVKNKLSGIETEHSTKEYSNYIQVLNNYRNIIDYKDIKNIIDLDRYYNAICDLDEQIQKYDLSSSTLIDFYVELNNHNVDTYELSCEIFKMFCLMFFKLDEYPVLSVVYGRKYGETSFFDTIGEFIDYLPYLVDKSVLGKELAEYFKQKSALFEEKNINFATLLNDITFYEKNKRIQKFLVNKTAFVFNYQGVDQTDNNELFEIIDNYTDYKESKLIRFSTKVIGDRINIYIYMPYVISQDEIDIIKRNAKDIISQTEELNGGI